MALTNEELLQLTDQGLCDLLNSLPLAGKGSTRTVYALDNSRVLKVAHSEAGQRANENEAHIWQLAENNLFLAQYLFPVEAQAPDFAWIVQEKAYYCLGPGNWGSFAEKLQDEEASGSFPGIRIWDLVNVNCGADMYGNSKVFDYGSWEVNE